MPNTVKVLKLTTDEKSSLECLLRCPTTEARKYIRAKILLLKSDSYTNEAIADKLDITVPTVRLCLQKYFAGGIDNALNDCKGKGRKQEISDDDITWVVNKACQLYSFYTVYCCEGRASKVRTCFRIFSQENSCQCQNPSF